MADEITPAPLELGPPAQPNNGESTPQVEQDLVNDLTNQYKTARAFDRPALQQIAFDRRYASGLAGREAPVNANLLGSYIDILVSFLYARNPKVSARPAEQTGRAAQRERQLFAKTLQIVIQRLWLEGKLKKIMKRVVRAGLSVATGWFKAAMRFDTETDPQIESELNDVRDDLEYIQGLEDELLDPDTQSPIDKDAKMAELELAIEGLEAKVEIVIRKTLAIDFVHSNAMVISLDVQDIDDYLQASFVGDEIFIPIKEVRGKFPRLTDEDLKAATIYYQKPPARYMGEDGFDLGAQGERIGDVDPHGDASLYTTNENYAGQGATQSASKPVQFVKCIELWDRRDVHIKTLIEGVKRWAKEPFTPRFATSRFYGYFKVDFFPVDGDRWPQSLTMRLQKLQDEYGSVRSSFRTTRQRSIPGTLFNAGMIESDDMDKIKNAAHDEFIPVKPRDAAIPLENLFAAKPQPEIDPMLFDTSPIIGDMEKLSGVQEALQTSQTVDKTATQAEIEQSGFAARTTSERDCVEETLGEFARYTAELALQALNYEDVRKIAGPLAVWPENLPLEYITSMLDIDIEAGSTGRPNTASERDAWIQLEPMFERMIPLVLSAPGTPLATAYLQLMRETLARFDDRLDIETFFPGIAVEDPQGLNAMLPPGGGGFMGVPGGPAPGAPGAAPMPGPPPALPAPDPEAAIGDALSGDAQASPLPATA